MRVVRALSVCAVLTVIVLLTTSGGRAQGPAVVFHGIGDLSGGGVGSAVRDATRSADGTLYAVGSSASVSTVVNGVVQLDTPALWTWSGGGALTALPPGTGVATNAAAGNALSAYAITPSATFIASQARSSTSGSGTNWVRVDRSQIPNTAANLNLSNAPSTPAFAALALSGTGDVIYGQKQNGSGGFPAETRVPVRYEPDTGRVSIIDVTPTGKTWGVPVPRGTSDDGLVMVGFASNGAAAIPPGFGLNGLFVAYANTVAFRYVHNAGTTTGTTTPIPFLRNDSIAWNMPVALSADGNQTLMIGSSEAFPNGEVYLTDAANNVTATLGSPNLALMPRALGGMTADGSVVAVTFAPGDQAAQFGPGQISGLGILPGGKHAYIHNAQGWFPFSSILAAKGVNLVAEQWDPTNLAITGIRTVEGKDLVFGQGRRRTPVGSNYQSGAVEGFVVELPAGDLAAFNPTPTPPTDQSIVGAWVFGTPASPTGVITYLADGTFYFINSAGFERGLYNWASTGGSGALTLTTLYDTNGATGVSLLNGFLGRNFTITGDTATTVDTNCPGCTPGSTTRITGATGSLIGGWIASVPSETPGDPDTRVVAALLDDTYGNRSFIAYDGPGSDGTGVELGTYEWDPIAHQLTFDTDDGNTATLSRDELGLTVVDGDGHTTFTFTRIVAPSTVVPVITNTTLEAAGAQNAAFAYAITATNALTFAAVLPAGLTIDAWTGVISGTPTVTGTFNIDVTVTNTFGATDTAILVLTLIAPSNGFHGIGDLTGGGIASLVRDATRLNGVLYAVGAATETSVASPLPALDTAVVWNNASGTLTPLPDLVTFPGAQPASANAVASAITPDAQFIASRARNNVADSSTSNAVRVPRTQMNSPRTAGGYAAQAISDDGRILATQLSGGIATVNNSIAIRVDVSGPSNTEMRVPLLGTYLDNLPAYRGLSSDGSVLVGTAFTGTFTNLQNQFTGTNGVAFRWVYPSASVTEIPRPAGGTWSIAIAVSPSGNLTLAAGNSPEYPNGEVWIDNAANPGASASFGSPNSALVPRIYGGMTADGSVVGVTFTNTGVNPLPASGKYAYIHNNNGWFHFSSVLAAQGISLTAQGWDPTNMAITGIRTVEGVDLVFGQGRRRSPGTSSYVDGAVEGFVVELPAGTLAAFNHAPTPPVDKSIIGAWAVGDPASPGAVVIYLPDGTFFFINGGGFERGIYDWAGNAGGGALKYTALHDTNGTQGLSGINAALGRTMTITGNTATFLDADCPSCVLGSITRIHGGPGSIVGSWVGSVPSETPGEADTRVVVTLLGQSSGLKSFIAYDGPGSDGTGVEVGTYVWDSTAHQLIFDGDDVNTATLSRDELGLTVIDGDGHTTFTFTRNVDPAAVPPAFIGALSIAGTVGFGFSHTIEANYTSSFTASGLPSGLSINPSTGVISGIPDIGTAGAYGVLLTAQNSLGGSANAALTIAISAPAVAVVPPGIDVVVEPEVPTGTPEVALTFDTVVGGGETTVAVIDPETSPELAPEPPANFSIARTDGGVELYYDITTTANFGGSPVTICFSYAGVDFGGQTPRLFHYVEGAWVDITTSVDTATETLCGETTSFSPFAIFTSTRPFRSAKGFYAPVSPIAGFVNTAKGGSTVPLKFDVYVNGVEKTDTTGLTLVVTPSQCTPTAEDPVDFESLGNTSLRYEGNQFIQNWKTPKNPGGCYTISVSFDEDGPAGEPATVLLTTKFKLK